MKIFVFNNFLLGLLLVAASCAKPVLSNMQKGGYKYDTAPKDVIEVAVSMLPLVKNTTEPEKAKTFFDLRDSLPHTYLKVISTKTDDPDKLITILTKPLSIIEKKANDKKPVDFTEYKVRFSFSNIKKYYNDSRFLHPNTRLEFLTTSLTIPTGMPFYFYNIDKLENEFEEINFGNIERSQTVTFNTKMSGQGELGASHTFTNSSKDNASQINKNGASETIYDSSGKVIGTISNSNDVNIGKENNSGSSRSAASKVSGNAEVGYLNSESIKEAVAAKLKRLKTGFSFSQKELKIAQRGRPLGDISDNIYVTATLKFDDLKKVSSMDVFSFDNLYDDKNQPAEANNLIFSKRNVNYIPCDEIENPVLTTNYEGAVRAVNSVKSSYGVNILEYDDKVTFYKIPNSNGQTLQFNKNLFCKNVFKVVATDRNDNIYNLNIAAPVEMELDLFVDDSPELFLQWLISNISHPDTKRLSTNRFKIYFENIRTHGRIYLVNDTIGTADIRKLKTLTSIKTEKRKQ